MTENNSLNDFSTNLKLLKAQTGAGLFECKKALQKNNGDMTAALDQLLKQNYNTALQKTFRLMKERRIVNYVHPGQKIGTLVEIQCETDFVARSQIFQDFCTDIAQQIIYSPELVDSASHQATDDEQILLLSNLPYFKNLTITVNKFRLQTISKLGENVGIQRFVKYNVQN